MVIRRWAASNACASGFRVELLAESANRAGSRLGLIFVVGDEGGCVVLGDDQGLESVQLGPVVFESSCLFAC